jgi:O-acetyl-ADP-ribose deacetylase (regulator of RNase III)
MIHRNGNLLDFAEAGMFDIVVQGCNCFNAMGGGIAREIRTRYPEVAEADRISEYADYRKLGTWTEGYAWYNTDKGDNADNFVIVNAYTQYEMSTGYDVFEYAAFELILQKLAHIYPAKRFGFPYIGMGLAQGNKHRIMMLLHDFARTIYASGGSVTLVRFE